MIPRRKPLMSTTELKRTSGLARTPLTRTTPLRSTGPTKAKRRDTGPCEAVRLLVRGRAGDRCEACGRRGELLDQHHRRPRGLGGSSDPATNRPANLVLLCRQCHRWVEAHRSVALDMGWLVLQGHDPASVPLLVFPDRLVLLTVDGRYVDYQDPQKGA